MPELLTLVLTLALGFVTGLLSGMFGVGGAVISNPGLRALGVGPLDTVGSTLPSIIPSSITGTIRYTRAGLVLPRVAIGAGLSGAAAAVLGALLADRVPGDGHLLMLSVAALMGITALRMVTTTTVDTGTLSAVDSIDQALWKVVAIGLLAGLLSGLLGIGGGILMVPLFVAWLHCDVKRAVATSLVCVGILAVPGSLTHALLGHVRWGFAIPLAIAAVPGAWIGAQITIGARERTVRLVIAALLGLIAAVYAVVEIVALVGTLD